MLYGDKHSAFLSGMYARHDEHAVGEFLNVRQVKKRRTIGSSNFFLFRAVCACLSSRLAEASDRSLWSGSDIHRVVVTVYMVGLGLGALLGGYLSERLRQRMLIYCFIELGIGLFGAASPDFLGFLGRHTAGSNYALSFVYMFAFLSIPTFLMGMTLPLLTKIFNDVSTTFLGRSAFYILSTPLARRWERSSPVM